MYSTVLYIYGMHACMDYCSTECVGVLCSIVSLQKEFHVLRGNREAVTYKLMSTKFKGD